MTLAFAWRHRPTAGVSNAVRRLSRSASSAAPPPRRTRLGTRLGPSSSTTTTDVARSRSASAASAPSAATSPNPSFDGDPSDLRYPHLFSPLPLHPAIGTLPNRVIMGSMHTGLEGHSIPSLLLPLLNAQDDHDDLSAMAAYFVERAKGGVGLMVTGGVAPNREGWVGPFAAKLSNKREMERHKVVTDAVHAVRIPSIDDPDDGEKARICLQILHAGRYAMHPFAVSASSTKSPISPFQARELSSNGIRRTIRDFVNCASLAKEAGYDGVEIMGSEGYLINQFLIARTNRRNDDYGGREFADRMKFAVDVVRETRDATGEDFIIIFRLSLLDLVKNGGSWEEAKTLARAVEDAGATIINTGIGWHEARIPTIATSVPRGAFSYVTRKLREEKIVDVPLCATNRINDPKVAERILATGDADLVSMARPFLADPDILKKSREGREDEINTCIACNQACLDHAFIGKTASCLVNPRACHELELQIVPDSVPSSQRLRIGVIGAGPAGLAFATTAADIGHAVTLYDASNEIGGQFNMAKRIPGKEEFHETIRYFRTKLSQLEQEGKVKMKLGTGVTHDDMVRLSSSSLREEEKEKGKIDKWIIATGVDPRVPPIPGLDHPNVLSYVDVLRRKKEVGRKVAIIGAGGIGFDVAEYLLHRDDSVDRDVVADDVDRDAFLSYWGVDETNEARGGLSPDGAKAEEPRREIVLMQRKKGKLGATLGKTTGWIHRSTLAKSNAVEMLSGVTYEKIDERGNLHVSVGSSSKGNDATKKRVLEVDNVVVCAGQVSRKDLEESAKGTDLEGRVYCIGGAYEAGELDAKRAIDMGTRLAVKIYDDDVVPGKHKFEADVGPEEKLFRLMRKFM